MRSYSSLPMKLHSSPERISWLMVDTLPNRDWKRARPRRAPSFGDLMKDNFERRNFIKQSVATGIVAAASRSRILGANERIRVGAIGIGRQGRGLTVGFKKNQDVEIVALCDVFEPQIAQTISEAKLDGVKTHKDFREVLE